MWTNNVRYAPESFGLTFIGEADLAEPDYSFDLVGVWKGEEGYYLATDSGCSCPTPFEDYNDVSDLTGPLTADQAKEEATTLWTESYGGGYDPEGFQSLMSDIV